MSICSAARRFGLLICAFQILGSPLAHAQDAGTVRGIVANDSGQPIAGASVELVALGSNFVSHETATDDRGRFEHAGLPPGHYSVTAERDDLGGQIYRVLVQPGGVVDVRFVLEAGRTAAPWLRTSHDDRSAAAAFDAGVRANRAGEFETAILQFRAALQIMPSCVDCHFNIGVSNTRLNRFDDAEAAYRAALTIRADHAASYYGLADIFSRQGRTEEAAAARGEANRIAVRTLETGRAQARDRLRRAQAFLTAGHVDDAVGQLDAALVADPTLVEAYYWLGLAHEAAGDLTAARRSLSRYIEATPTGEHAGDARRRIDALQQ